MALVHIPPVETHVRWDRRAHRPRELRGRGHRVRVAAVDGVRDELAAHPADTGPRLTVVLRTMEGGRVAIVFNAKRGRWYLEALEPGP